MKKSVPVRFILIASMLTVLFLGCKKEESESLSQKEEEEAAMVATVSETETEFTFNDVFDNVIGVNAELGIAGVGIFARVTTTTPQVARVDSTRCFTVTITPLQPGVFPKTVVMDFGTGCTTHGRTRSGKIRTVYTGPLTVPGNSATTTFENYKIDNISVEGTHKITNTTNTTTGSNQRQFTVTVTDAKLTKPNGDYSQWSGHRVTTQIEGNGTLIPHDDFFSIRGTAKGKVKHGNNIYLWNSEITEPLIKKFTCRWISKGKIRVVRETLPATSPWASVLDYGNGTCDNKATLTINGVTKEITLR